MKVTHACYISIIGLDGKDLTDRVAVLFDKPTIRCNLKIRRPGAISMIAMFQDRGDKEPYRLIRFQRVTPTSAGGFVGFNVTFEGFNKCPSCGEDADDLVPVTTMFDGEVIPGAYHCHECEEDARLSE